MFEKIGRLAETAANQVSVSRRGFLGRLGQGALAMTGVLGGLLAIRTNARAGGVYVCCSRTYLFYGREYTERTCYPPGTTCPSGAQQKTVHSCKECTSVSKR
jgi:hypothetical protein